MKIPKSKRKITLTIDADMLMKTPLCQKHGVDAERIIINAIWLVNCFASSHSNPKFDRTERKLEVNLMQESLMEQIKSQVSKKEFNEIKLFRDYNPNWTGKDISGFFKINPTY